MAIELNMTMEEFDKRMSKLRPVTPKEMEKIVEANTHKKKKKNKKTSNEALKKIKESFDDQVKYIVDYDYDFDSLSIDDFKRLYNFIFEAAEILAEEENKNK